MASSPEASSPALVTIPFSHFCEKARWALDRTGVSYRERGYLPFLHLPFVWAAGGRRTVPLLTTGEAPLTDSTDILRWADARGARLWPHDPQQAAEVSRWEERFDAELGVDARRVAYAHVLDDRAYMDAMLARCAPPWQRVAFAASRPVALGLMKRGLGLDPARTARSMERMLRTFDDVAASLADGRAYLAGEAFSAADLTFAALASPVLLPPELTPIYGTLGDLPSEAARLVERLRDSVAGRYALRLYAEHRRASAA